MKRRLFHYSEDPGITRFVPHVAATAASQEPRVWAVDREHAPSYWFPRACPRACCWLRPGQPPDVAPDLLRAAPRAHYIQRDWHQRLRACQLYAYELDPAPFALEDAEGGFWIARTEPAIIACRRVGSLVARHRHAGIPVIVTTDLRPIIDAVVASGLGFSIIRARNL